MKSLAIGKSIQLEGQTQATPYKELLLMSLKNAPKEGFGLEEMEARLKIKKVLNDATETLELEDADMAKLQQCVAQMTWAVLDDGLMEFLKAVKAA